MKLLAILIAAALGYFLGSVNFSIPVVKMFLGKDIRTLGSKNAGLTNTFRCAGKKCAVFTLVGDLLKGIIAVSLSRWICGLLNAGLAPDNDTHYIGYIAGLFAILGHVFPIYFGFKGGKGVLVGIASFLMVDPKVFCALLAIFIVIVAITKYISAGSIIGAAFCPIATLLMAWFVEGQSFGRSFLYMLLSLPMAFMVVFMHRTNIERLKNGTENKFSFKTSGTAKD
ncbi:MAG: glycerol-3-phosphate 1-O-acyltransferase PlsY [Ruminococcus sp.]|nr:glycerol-3-phosphate 1-O-acyltransferase PlsY [Ruminococcus sp.]